VSTEGGSHIVYVHKPDAWLAYDEGVGWRWDYPVCNVRLKIDDTSIGKIEVIPPPSHNRIRFNPYVSTLLEKREKSFSHFLKTVASAGRRVADKS